MLKSTETAIRAIVATDPSISPESLKAGLRVFAGIGGGDATPREPIDRAVTRQEAAHLLGVNVKTITSYVRAGRLTPIGLPDARGYHRRIAESSLRRLLNGETTSPTVLDAAPLHHGPTEVPPSPGAEKAMLDGFDAITTKGGIE